MVKIILLILVSLIPISKVRLLSYRFFFNYEIDAASYVGMFNLLELNSLEMVNARIGYFNLIKVNHLIMGDKSYIHKKNMIKNLNEVIMKNKAGIFSNNFIGGINKENKSENFDFALQNLIIGNRSAVNRRNYFDVLRPIIIGDNVVFGGEGSEIWTHGFDLDRNLLPGGVTFGDNIFIGSKCVFTKNINICDKVTIGPGSVIYKSIKEPGFYTTHQIVKVN